MKILSLFIACLSVQFLVAQSEEKIQADLMSKNQVSESKIYRQKPNGIKILYKWMKFDRQGRLVESKMFAGEDQLKRHYRFEFPNGQSRTLISVNNKGEEIERTEQRYEMDENYVNQRLEDDDTYQYKYDERGNNIQVMRTKNGKQSMQSKTKFNEQNLIEKKIESVSVFGKDQNLTTDYKRDGNGLLMEKKQELNGRVQYLEVYEYQYFID